MIIGIGTDIVEINRVMRACLRWPKFPARIFTKDEWEYCNEGHNHASLAARFAAKEAVAKALGTGMRGMDWTEIEILNDLAGAPFATLSGKAHNIAKEKGISQIMITLSHSKDYAVAYAVALGG
ncbi:MAG: holo-ACP synthase [Bacillota bacterium]|nr:holo-ACP synthase [Bacillota bacterium]